MLRSFLVGLSYSDRQKEIKYFIHSNFGVYPKNIVLYEQAFTHKSYQAEDDSKATHNERLEFLGDAILGAIIADILYLKYPKKSEGELTQMRSRIVSRDSLNAIGNKLHLEPLILYHKTKSKFNSLLGNTFESLVGALYLDLGYQKTYEIFKQVVIIDLLNLEELALQNTDYKSQLLVDCQKNKRIISFELIEELQESSGESLFTMAIIIDGEEKSRATASSKRKAEQRAAKQLFF